MLKEDLEANLRTPYIYGFELLDLHDYLGQGTALVGILDPFWDSKGYVTPNEWRQFCDETVLLARIESYCIDLAKNATISIPIEVSHFGRAPLQSVRIHWQLEQQPVTEYTYGEHGKTLTQTVFQPPVLCGTLKQRDYALEKNQSAGCIYLNMEDIEPNRVYTLRVSMKANGRIVENIWPLWIFDSSKLNPVSTPDESKQFSSHQTASTPKHFLMKESVYCLNCHMRIPHMIVRLFALIRPSGTHRWDRLGRAAWA